MTHSNGSPRHLGPAVLGLVLFLIAGATAMSVDVPRTGYGIKSDEATYVAATLSAAFDGDLAFERRDLERFAGLYHAGPDGIFLKRGKQLRLRTTAAFPFLTRIKREDPNPNRLFFGKSLAYPLAAAPFVRLLGLNGLLVFHVVLISLTGLAGYMFLAAQSPPVSAATFVSAFLGASVLPVYGVLLMPEVFNVTLVTLAYFLWLYKEVAPASRMAARWTDFAAVVLLGICTYSKPLPTAVLVAPVVLLSWFRRDWVRGSVLGLTAVTVASLFFAFNAAVSGEFNYQGGDRKVFYSRFPFDAPEASWDRRGGLVTTDTSTPREVLSSSEIVTRLSHNIKYFLVGRHFGFVPYFFPGLVAIAWWLAGPARRVPWRILVFGTAIVAALGLLILLPWTWSGDGGPAGNRYFSLRRTRCCCFSCLRRSHSRLRSLRGLSERCSRRRCSSIHSCPRSTHLSVEKGLARRLPVELTMANTLPLRLAQPLRGHVQYRYDPGVLLLLLDQNAWPPEPNGMWVSGAGRADIIVRAAAPFERMAFEAESPIHTVATIALGDEPVTVKIEPGTVFRFEVKASGVHGLGDYNYLMTVRSTEGFVPHLLEPQNMDYRNLGVQLRFRPVSASGVTP